MHILLTAHQFFPQYASGTEVLTYSVAQELIARGHVVHVLTGYPNDNELTDEERFDEYDFEGVHVYRFHHAYTPMAGQISMVELSYDNHLAAKCFERILEKFKPDVVHFFHLNRLGTGLIEIAVKAKIPAFMTPTDFWAICHTGQLVLCNGSMCLGPSSYGGNCVKHLTQVTQKGLIGTIAKWLPAAWFGMLARLTQKGVMPRYPHEDEVKAISVRLGVNVARINQLNGMLSPNRFMTETLKRHGILPNLIIESAFGIDVGGSEPNMSRPLPSNLFRIGFIGTLAQHKGCHVLIDAFNALPRGQAVLRIYGNMEERPEYSNELKLLAGNNQAIEFCGTFHNSKIGEIFANLDVLVVPSLWYENTPLVVYSAQASRCPVIASDFPGISEVIHDQINGLLFEAGNSVELTKLLSRLMNEPALAECLSLNSKQPKSTASYVDDLLNMWRENE